VTVRIGFEAMADPLVDAARDIAGDSLEALRRVVAEAPDDLLNWRPAGEDTNSIAVLAVHAVTSTRWWLSLAITGAGPQRERAEEFRTIASNASELLEHVDPLIADCRSLLASDAPLDAAAPRAEPDGSATTAAWALVHAVEHLREHVAQAELTRQVWDRTRTA
jgi:hypothetical protein